MLDNRFGMLRETRGSGSAAARASVRRSANATMRANACQQRATSNWPSPSASMTPCRAPIACTYEVGGGIGRAIAGHEDQETRGPAPWGGWRR